jgi:hypothetical protein
MNDIFVSYKKQDADRVRVLVRALEKKGFSVWWDRTIPPGSTWAQVIEQAIDGCRVVMVVWSDLSSTSDWVHKEARRGESRQILVPVLIDDVEIPFEFEHIQGARLVGWDGSEESEEFRQLVRRVEETVEASPDASDRAAEAEERERRRTSARRSLLARRAGAALGWVAFAGVFGVEAMRPASSASLRLRNLELTGIRFTVPAGGDGVAVGAASGGARNAAGAILVFEDLPVREIAAFGLDNVEVPSPGGGPPDRFEDDPLFFVEPLDASAAVSLSALRLLPGAQVELQRLADRNQMVIHDAAGELGVDVQGRIAVHVEAEDTLAFAAPVRVVLHPHPEGVTLEFDPVADTLTLVENLAVSGLRLYRVDQDVGLQGTELNRISTIRSGTLSADWLREPLELSGGEGLRFASFDGEILRLTLGDGRITLNADGRVTGLATGLGGEGDPMMPTRLASLDGTLRWLVLGGGLLGLGVLATLNLRLWRRSI